MNLIFVNKLLRAYNLLLVMLLLYSCQRREHAINPAQEGTSFYLYFRDEEDKIHQTEIQISNGVFSARKDSILPVYVFRDSVSLGKESFIKCKRIMLGNKDSLVSFQNEFNREVVKARQRLAEMKQSENWYRCDMKILLEENITGITKDLIFIGKHQSQSDGEGFSSVRSWATRCFNSYPFGSDIADSSASKQQIFNKIEFYHKPKNIETCYCVEWKNISIVIYNLNNSGYADEQFNSVPLIDDLQFIKINEEGLFSNENQSLGRNHFAHQGRCDFGNCFVICKGN
jgi:hypothetical protein